jgi:hypothetical protein
MPLSDNTIAQFYDESQYTRIETTGYIATYVTPPVVHLNLSQSLNQRVYSNFTIEEPVSKPRLCKTQ